MLSALSNKTTFLDNKLKTIVEKLNLKLISKKFIAYVLSLLVISSNIQNISAAENYLNSSLGKNYSVSKIIKEKTVGTIKKHPKTTFTVGTSAILGVLVITGFIIYDDHKNNKKKEQLNNQFYNESKNYLTYLGKHLDKFISNEEAVYSVDPDKYDKIFLHWYKRFGLADEHGKLISNFKNIFDSNKDLRDKFSVVVNIIKTSINEKISLENALSQLKSSFNYEIENINGKYKLPENIDIVPNENTDVVPSESIKPLKKKKPLEVNISKISDDELFETINFINSNSIINVVKFIENSGYDISYTYDDLTDTIGYINDIIENKSFDMQSVKELMLPLVVALHPYVDRYKKLPKLSNNAQDLDDKTEQQVLEDSRLHYGAAVHSYEATTKRDNRLSNEIRKNFIELANYKKLMQDDGLFNFKYTEKFFNAKANIPWRDRKINEIYTALKINNPLCIGMSQDQIKPLENYIEKVMNKYFNEYLVDDGGQKVPIVTFMLRRFENLLNGKKDIRACELLIKLLYSFDKRFSEKYKGEISDKKFNKLTPEDKELIESMKLNFDAVTGGCCIQLQQLTTKLASLYTKYCVKNDKGVEFDPLKYIIYAVRQDSVSHVVNSLPGYADNGGSGVDFAKTIEAVVSPLLNLPEVGYNFECPNRGLITYNNLANAVNNEMGNFDNIYKQYCDLDDPDLKQEVDKAELPKISYKDFCELSEVNLDWISKECYDNADNFEKTIVDWKNSGKECGFENVLNSLNVFLSNIEEGYADSYYDKYINDNSVKNAINSLKKFNKDKLKLFEYLKNNGYIKQIKTN